MRIRNLSIMLALLMVLSVLPLGQIQVNSHPMPTESDENLGQNLHEEFDANKVEGRQTVTDSAHWDFDTTSFAMMATSTTSAGVSGIEYHPCEAAWGWRDDAAPGAFNSQVPHLRWYFGGGINGNPYYPPQTHYNGDLDCYTWDEGTEKYGYEFSVNTGDGTTEYVPQHTSHDVGRYANHAQWQQGMDVYLDSSSWWGELNSDNILDFDVDNDGNTYVVGAWDGNKLVFPNVVGTHVYLDNSGKNTNGPDLYDYDGLNTIDENHDKDIFVAKMDSNGQWLWASSIYYHGVETASSIAVSKLGEVYIGGTISCEQGKSAVFPDQPRSTIQNSQIQGIEMPCGDDEPVGFVARMDTGGAFTHAKVVENEPVFSSVTDIALDSRADDTLYYIGSMGSCLGHSCPTSDSYMVGKFMTDTSLNPSPWAMDWVEFVDGFTMTEIEMTSGGAILTGFTESAATLGSVSIPEDLIVVSKVASQKDSAGEVVWDWANSCDPISTSDNWDGWMEGNPSWGLSVGANIAMLVEPGSECGGLDNGFYGFQAVSLDLDGNWLWSNGDTKDTSNMPQYLQFSNNAHASDLDHSTNGDVIISVNLGKIVMVNGANYVPQNGAADILMLRLDDDTGTRIWHHQEVNSECANPSMGYKLSSSNTCTENKRGGADARRIVVKNLDDIYMSGMVYGKEIYLHDGLPEHCDYSYADPYWQDAAGNYQQVPADLQGSTGGQMSYFTKCVDSNMWETASGSSMPANAERVYPQHGTQWHGGNPYFAKFDACPRAQGSAVADPVGLTTGRSDWYVTPVGEPSNVNNTRYDCDDGTYLDPSPLEPEIIGCMDVYAANYDPTATIQCADCCEYDSSPPWVGGATGNNGEPCNCVPKDSISNMTDSGELVKVHVMEITAPKSAGSPQGIDAGYYHLQLSASAQVTPNGMLGQKLTDVSMLTDICDLRTSAKECYDFYTSDMYGNFDEFGEFIAIRTYNPILHAGNLDAVWLEMANGDYHYAVDIVYFDHGNAPPGTSYEHEILGAPNNDPSTITGSISSPTGFTHLGPQFTTIVLCFDTAPVDEEKHKHSDGTTHSHEGGLDEHSHEEEKEDCETCEEDTLPSLSLIATLGVTMLAVFVSRRRVIETPES